MISAYRCWLWHPPCLSTVTTVENGDALADTAETALNTASENNKHAIFVQHAYMTTHIQEATWTLSSYEKAANIWITDFNVITNNEHCQLRTIYLYFISRCLDVSINIATHLDPPTEVTVLCVHSITICIVLKIKKSFLSGPDYLLCRH